MSKVRLVLKTGRACMLRVLLLRCCFETARAHYAGMQKGTSVSYSRSSAAKLRTSRFAIDENLLGYRISMWTPMPVHGANELAHVKLAGTLETLKESIKSC